MSAAEAHGITHGKLISVYPLPSPMYGHIREFAGVGLAQKTGRIAPFRPIVLIPLRLLGPDFRPAQKSQTLYCGTNSNTDLEPPSCPLSSFRATVLLLYPDAVLRRRPKGPLHLH
jgi:hypothetical protein